MKKGLCWKKLLSIGCVATTAFILPISACRSSGQEDVTPKIILNSKDITTNEYRCKITGHTENISCESIEAKIEKIESKLIALQDETISIQDDQFVVNFIIDGSVIENTKFNFDLSFTFIKEDGQSETIKIENLNIYFLYEHEHDVDRVSIENRTIEQTDNHTFNFKFYFNQLPQSNITVSLENETTGLLVMPETEYIIGPDRPVNIVVPIYLNIGVHQNQAINFNLKLKFTNSFGKEQETDFVNCVVSFIDGKMPYIPDDYLEIEETHPSNDDTEFVLKGLKEGVNPIKVQSYSQLIIPDYVTIVDKMAFADSIYNYDSINKIVIPKSVKQIGEYAFGRIQEIVEIDISGYDEYPDWLRYNSDPRHLIPIFNNLTWQSGYLWIGKETSMGDPSVYLNEFIKIGCREKWIPCLTNDIFPYENYELKSEGTILTKIKDEAIDQLENYKIIRIPDEVQVIESDAFIQLATHPYINKQPNAEGQKETRRLILNGNLEVLPSQCFLNAGIGGPIVIAAPHLRTIPESAFENCTNYGNPPISDVVVEDTSIIFANCDDLKLIEQFAFNQVPLTILNDDNIFKLPNNLTGISNFAFFGSKFKQIIFPNNDLVSVGDYAFADTYSWPESPSIEYIDLSVYNEIVNPGEEKPTYIPDWFVNDDYAFEGNVKAEGKIVLSSKIRDELEEDEEIEKDEWEKIFKGNHGLPEDWEIEYIDS